MCANSCVPVFWEVRFSNGGGGGREKGSFDRIVNQVRIRGPGASLGRILEGPSIEPFWEGGEVLARRLYRTPPTPPPPRPPPVQSPPTLCRLPIGTQPQYLWALRCTPWALTMTNQNPATSDVKTGRRVIIFGNVPVLDPWGSSRGAAAASRDQLQIAGWRLVLADLDPVGSALPANVVGGLNGKTKGGGHESKPLGYPNVGIPTDTFDFPNFFYPDAGSLVL